MPRSRDASRNIDLSNISEQEFERIRGVIERDVQLQEGERNRLAYAFLLYIF